MDLEKYDYLSWMVSSSAFSHLSKTIHTTEGIGGRPTIYSKSMELSRFYYYCMAVSYKATSTDRE
jgi:hypothetical protein